VEQFIRGFEDVATIAEWPVRVRILQLWACLTGRAKSFTLGPDEAHIMRALRARFGLTAEEAADRLQVMRRDRRTPLEDHANEVERRPGSGCFQSRHWQHRIVKGNILAATALLRFAL